jgi:hypothetical protein
MSAEKIKDEFTSFSAWKPRSLERGGNAQQPLDKNP